MVSRKAVKTRKFKRQDYHRYKKLSAGWRRPRGRQSKLRKGKSGNPPKPKIGYGTMKQKRGLVDEKKVFFVSSIADIDKLVDKEKSALILSGKFGLKKFAEVVKKAEEMDLLILNKKRMKKVSKRMKCILQSKKNKKEKSKDMRIEEQKKGKKLKMENAKELEKRKNENEKKLAKQKKSE